MFRCKLRRRGAAAGPWGAASGAMPHTPDTFATSYYSLQQPLYTVEATGTSEFREGGGFVQVHSTPAQRLMQAPTATE